MGQFDYLLGAQPVQIPNPLALAQQGMSLSALANQSKLAQYQIQQAQRQDAAANSFNQALGNIDFSNPQSVMSALQNSDPAARPLIVKAALDYQTKQAGIAKDTAEAKKNTASATTSTIAAASGLAADAARMNTPPAQVQASAKALGLDPNIFAVPDGQDPQTYYAAMARSGITAQQQATLGNTAAAQAETGRHNLTTEGLTAQGQANTALYQSGQLGQGAQRNRIAAVTADPFNMFGLNPPQAPQQPQVSAPPQSPATPGFPVVPPQVQQQRDQQSLQLLLGERAALAAKGQTDPNLEREIAVRSQTAAGGQPPQSANPPSVSVASGADQQMSVQQAMAQGLHGDDFLATLPPAVASQVKRLAEGKQQVPQGAALRSPQIQQLLALTSQYDPTFDAVDYGMRYRTAQDFAPQGKSGQNITALNTAIGHLAGLKQAMDSLNNFGGMATPLNAPINAVESAFGSPQQLDVAMHANAVAGELAKVFRSTGMSEADIQGWKDKLSQNLSPAQQSQVVSSAIDLMNSRLEAIGDAYTRGMGKASAGINLLSPDAQAAYASLTSGQKPPARAYAPGQARPPVAQPQDRNAIVAQALDAISKGAPPAAVKARLQQMGITDAPI